MALTDILLAIVQASAEWDTHTLACAKCFEFDTLPDEAPYVLPCAQGWRLIRKIMNLISKGLPPDATNYGSPFAPPKE